MTRSVLAMTMLFSFAATAAQAPSFESLDKNSDGKVSVHEASENEALFVAFKKLDANKDGELTKEEFSKHTG